MKPTLGGRVITALYVMVFLTYLLGPLAVMMGTAFNSSQFPRVMPWECFTAEWFTVLASDDALLKGLRNSLIIGLGVVVFSVPIGLAGALWLGRIAPRYRAMFYTLFIAPILIPGVVLGIAALVFWRRLDLTLGTGVFYDPIFMTIAAQITFISAYAMLVFLARLQRFDNGLMEAALDLGATPLQAFRRILLPFLAPAIVSAAVVAFLASLENYNTTVFTIVAENTFTTELASKVRYGFNPSISAVTVIIVGLTLVAAILFESFRANAVGRANGVSGAARLAHPAVVGAVLVALIGGGAWAMASHDPGACKADIRTEKLARQRELMERQREAMRARQRKQEAQNPAAPASPFGGGVFDPGNLAPAAPAPAPAPSPFGGGGVFDPGNLAPAAPEPAPAPSPFGGGVFDPGNLAPPAPQ